MIFRTAEEHKKLQIEKKKMERYSNALKYS